MHIKIYIANIYLYLVNNIFIQFNSTLLYFFHLYSLQLYVPRNKTSFTIPSLILLILITLFLSVNSTKNHYSLPCQEMVFGYKFSFSTLKLLFSLSNSIQTGLNWIYAYLSFTNHLSYPKLILILLFLHLPFLFSLFFNSSSLFLY